MKFSYGRFGNMKPKVARFSCWSMLSKRASQKTLQKVEAWLSENEGRIKIYRMRATTKNGWFGISTRANFYIFYKDLPR